jgi:tRNA modification GTPase
VNLDDTIVAVITPAGRGGIGVVRLAGAEACAIARPMFRLRRPLEPGRAIVGEFVEPPAGDGAGFEPGGSRIDEVVVTYFRKPHSYTADDVVEISAHGSPVVLAHLVELALRRGARLAEPGEFTWRAFLNGRIDLTQAEAVRDLIDAQTLYQAKVAAQQLDGALSRRLAPVKHKLLQSIAALEAGIDFAEDDVSVVQGEQILDALEQIALPLSELARSFDYGKIVLEGLTLAIVGRPNVGKSSLFNRLVERERAIVTAAPGTTRDLVTDTVAIGGIPVKLVDTAGIRPAIDEAERIGVSKSMEALADADLVLLVLDGSQAIGREDQDLLDRLMDRDALVIANKCDLGDAWLSSGLAKTWSTVSTSAVTGQGIRELRAEILARIRGEDRVGAERGLLTNARHQSRVSEALAALEAARTAVAERIPHEMVLLDLYRGLQALDELTGVTTKDDVLNLIFSTFCIGK